MMTLKYMKYILRVSQVIDNCNIQKLSYCFLFTFCRKYDHIFGRFSDIQSQNSITLKSQLDFVFKMAPFNR